MQIRPITPADVKGGFTCGRAAFDEYLRKRAWGHEQQGVARVFVLEDLAAPGDVLGYYTLAASAWERERLRGPFSGSLPTDPLPILYIGHFAVTTARQRQGLGSRLMADALRRCVEAHESIGALGIGLDSLDDDSTRFYTQVGFVAVPPEPSRPTGDTRQPMFLAMRTLIAAKPPGA